VRPAQHWIEPIESDLRFASGSLDGFYPIATTPPTNKLAEAGTRQTGGTNEDDGNLLMLLRLMQVGAHREGT